ncbi:MAG: (deoxy)nucleoside triphosphate pyrophosphohydrolase [Spirochaetia bacterium]
MIDVVAAIIKKDNKYLIGKRSYTGSLPGKWEFPGGKVKTAETNENALIREIAEELGVFVQPGHKVGTVDHFGEEKAIRLIGYEVDAFIGDIENIEHEEIRWVDPCEFDFYDFGEADKKLIDLIFSAECV